MTTKVKLHLPQCRRKCKELALMELRKYLDEETLKDVTDACIRPEVPFPIRYTGSWLVRGLVPNPIGTIEASLGGSKPYTYPLSVVEDTDTEQDQDTEQETGTDDRPGAEYYGDGVWIHPDDLVDDPLEEQSDDY